MLNNVYLLHHRDEKFKKRYDYITERLKYQNIIYKIVDDYHPDVIDYEKLMQNFEFYPQIIIEQLFNLSYINFAKKISKGSLSLVLKHMKCWKEQIQNNYEYILVLEDDAEIPDNFSEIVDKIMLEIKSKNCELVMLGTTEGFISPNILENNLLHFNSLQKTRCTHAYIINKSCSQKMLNRFQNFNLPIDFKMNEVIQLETINVWWYEPGIKQKLFN